MPRLYHRPPKYCLHKGTNQACVSIQGQRVYLGPYGSASSHEKYQEVLAKWNSNRESELLRLKEERRAKLQAKVTPAQLRQKRNAGSPLIVNELVYVYRLHTYSYYRKNGRVTREATIIDDALRILRKHHGTSYVDSFGPVALDELRDAMITELDWSRSYINKQVNRVIRMFTWGSEKELVSPQIPLGLKSLAGLRKGRTSARETDPVECVADEVVDATLEHLPEIIADMVRLQRLTGARPGEICSLRPGDIDRTTDVWVYAPHEHKTEHHEKHRVVVLGPRAQEILMPYLLRATDSFCFSPIESERRRRAKRRAARKTPLSCGNRTGTNRKLSPKRLPRDRYDTCSYRQAIQRVCKRHGIPKWAPNQIRHTSATEIRKEFGLEAAQVICGHQNAHVTQVYAERNLELAKKVAREVG